MILMLPEEAAAEFGVSLSMVERWARLGHLEKHPRPRRPNGGHPGYWVARHEVKRLASRMRPPERRGGRPSPSRETPRPEPAPDPTSPQSPAPR